MTTSLKSVPLIFPAPIAARHVTATTSRRARNATIRATERER